jgi:hypothetical protein
LANSERCRAISASPPSVETNSHHGTTWRATFILQRASEYTARGISCSNIALHPPPAHALKIACAKTDVQTISYGPTCRALLSCCRPSSIFFGPAAVGRAHCLVEVRARPGRSMYGNKFGVRIVS